MTVSLRTIISSTLFIFGMFLVFAIGSNSAIAGYDGGRIIDDTIFRDTTTMSRSDVQDFLEYWDSGLADREFELMCYGSDSQEREWYTNAGATCDEDIPASHIIYYAAKIYGINPQVILATLQKEQSLITSSNPTSRQISQAMGYACPTTGSCNSDSNFSYQVDSGTWVLRWHYERASGNNSWWRTSSGWSCGTYRAPGSSFYSPNLYPDQNVKFYDGNGVHYRTHYIENAATSSLYCYTPHAYNNPEGLYGRAPFGTKGQYYSGSYNFVTAFENWFGSTSGSLKISRSLYFSPAKPVAGGTVATSFIVKNTSDDTLDLDRIVVAARDSKGRNQDFPTVRDISLDPGEEYEYYERQVLYTEGEHDFFIAAYRNSTGWTTSWPAKVKSSVKKNADPTVKDPNVEISRSLYHSPVQSAVNQRKTVSFKVKNNEPYRVDVGRLIVGVRDSMNKLHDYPGINLVLDPGETYEYRQSRTFDIEDENYRMFIANYRPDRGWTSSWPKKARSSISTDHDFYVRNSNVKLSRSLYLSPVNSSRGETKAASFIIRNDEAFPVTIRSMTVAVRDPNNKKFDFPARKNVTLLPGQSYVYYERRTLPNSGTHRAWVAFKTESGSWTKSWPAGSNSSVQNERTFNVLP